MESSWSGKVYCKLAMFIVDFPSKLVELLATLLGPYRLLEVRPLLTVISICGFLSRKC